MNAKNYGWSAVTNVGSWVGGILAIALAIGFCLFVFAATMSQLLAVVSFLVAFLAVLPVMVYAIQWRRFELIDETHELAIATQTLLFLQHGERRPLQSIRRVYRSGGGDAAVVLLIEFDDGQSMIVGYEAMFSTWMDEVEGKIKAAIAGSHAAFGGV